VRVALSSYTSCAEPANSAFPFTCRYPATLDDLSSKPCLVSIDRADLPQPMRSARPKHPSRNRIIESPTKLCRQTANDSLYRATMLSRSTFR
jgi:hypothetical protein